MIFIISTIRAFPLEEIKIGEKNNGNPIITYNINLLKQLLENMMNDGTIIVNVEIHNYELSYYLVGIGTKEGNPVLVSFRLNENGEDLITYKTVIVDLHSCEGINCSSCSFQKDGAGNITGCQCNSPIYPSGYCNHSVRQVPINL